MSPRARRILIGLIVGGTMLRLGLAFGAFGVVHDIESYRLTGEALFDRGLDVYEGVQVSPGSGAEVPTRWPYPGGLFPWILIALLIARIPWLPFHGVIQLPMVAADAAIAVLVCVSLRRRGAAEPRALAGAGLVAFGPSFFLISGYMGQLDAVAILPALAAVEIWERSRDGRARWAGVLLGLGGALKTVPLILLLALLPSRRSIREAARTTTWAAGMAAAAVVPFLLESPRTVVEALGYAGIPGVGGLSLVLQPSLAESWILGSPFHPSALTQALDRSGPVLVGGVLVGVGTLLWRARARPVEGAVLLWLGIYAFAPNFFFQYLVWGLPFFLIAGYLREVAVLQAVVLAPTLLGLLRPWDDPRLLALYVPLMVLVWLGFVAAFAGYARRLMRDRRRSDGPRLHRRTT